MSVICDRSVSGSRNIILRAYRVLALCRTLPHVIILTAFHKQTKMLKKLFPIFAAKPPVRDIVPPSHIVGTLVRELADQEIAAYTLRMSWLGRSDKFPGHLSPTFDWLSRTFLPAPLAASYEGFRPGVIQLRGEDHDALARKCIEDAVTKCDLSMK